MRPSIPGMRGRAKPRFALDPALVARENLIDERSFLNTLRLERKRAGRSGQRFVLVVLEFGTSFQDSAMCQAFDRFLSQFLPSIRETDHRGWYVQDSVLGVIFTDIGEIAYGVVLDALSKRVGQALTSEFKSEQLGAIRISFSLFPDPLNSGDSTSEPDFRLYRDVVRNVATERTYQLTKRALDIAVSLSCLCLLSPLLLIIAIAIKLTSPGPVLFRQPRVGQHFRSFTFFKFRSMRANCDDALHKAFVAHLIAGPTNSPSAASAAFKIKNDPRVTALGRFLRRSSLDELPQLLNVVLGDMTLVGPRPCLRYELANYAVWHRQRLVDVKPGITGLWQVAGRSRVSFDEMVRLDLTYVKRRSVWLDIKILVKTPRAVISGAGAY